MSVTSMKTNDDKRVELEIKVDAETFEKAVDAAFKRNSKRMNVPGFRRGKAPRKMIERLYGEGVFYEEAVNNTYPAAYEDAVKEKSIEPVDRADIEVMQVGKDGYSFKATVTVKPEVSIEGYKGIEVEKKVAQATDAEVDAELSRMQAQNGRVIAVEGRAAQDGDTAVIDFEGFVDGKAFEGGKGEKYPLELGSNSFIEGFEGQVVGHNVGDEFEVNVTFPENYHAEELKGKPAVFKCKLHELKTKDLPALDDEFAKDVSEFDTLDELKADLKKKAQERHDSRSETETENKLMEAVCAKMTVDIPQCMYERRIDEMVREFEYRLQSQGLNLQTYLQYAGMELESFRKTYAAQAEAQVKTRLALEKIAELEKLAATEEEINGELLKIAGNYNMDVERVRKIVSPEDVAHNLAMGKALDLVRDSAVITEVKEEAALRRSRKRHQAACQKGQDRGRAAETSAESAE